MAASDKVRAVRILFRLVAFLALVAAVIAGTIDAIRSVAGNRLLLTPLSTTWTATHAGSLDALHRLLETYLPHGFVGGFDWLLQQPAVAVLLVLSFIFYLIGYRRRARMPRR